MHTHVACLSAFPCQVVVDDDDDASATPRDSLKFYENDSSNPSKSTLNALHVGPRSLSNQVAEDARHRVTRKSRIKPYSEETTLNYGPFK